MKQFISVMNSDAVNRYGYRFSTGALVSGAHDGCLVGIPWLVAHDHSRPLGWVYPIAVYLEPGMTRLVSVSQLPETGEDRDLLNRQFEYHYYTTYIEPNRAEREQLRELIQKHLLGKEKIASAECVAFYESDLAKRTFPKLFSLADKDGLVSLRDLSPIEPGVYQIGELVVFAHHYFRRNLGRLNNLNYPLLDLLHQIANSNDTVKVALDPDTVGLATSYNGRGLELQYWWGPKFDNDLTSIPLGVTHHEADEIEKMMYGISATQFRWGTGTAQHIFEAEELRDLPSALESPDRYGCRYVHSIVDQATGAVEHLDGAVRIYSEEKMLQRLECNLDKAPRDTDYQKLWRVDGSIDIASWKRLISDHYRDNYLVGEYFGAEGESLHKQDEIQSGQEKSLVEEFVPFSMNKGMGIRVALAYSNLENFQIEHEISIIPLDRISDGDDGQPYIEVEAIELQKALRKRDVHLHIADEVQLVSFRDLYVNLPLVFCRKQNPANEIQHLITAIKTLVAAWQKTGYDWVICYKIGFPIDDERAAIVSVLGHVEDLARWLSSDLESPPTNMEGLRQWAEQVSKYLREAFLVQYDTPALAKTIMPTGVLLIDRRRIGYGNFDIEYSNEIQGHIYSLPIPENEVNLAHALEQAGIVPGVGLLIQRSRCTNCKEPYRDCNCSILLDEGVADEILNAIPFPFWTDRPV